MGWLISPIQGGGNRRGGHGDSKGAQLHTPAMVQARLWVPLNGVCTRTKTYMRGGSESQVEITCLLQPLVLTALSVLRIRQAVCLVDIDWGLSLHQAPV